MKATLKFRDRATAILFARIWALKTLTGHDMSSTGSDGSTSVTVYDIDDLKKQIIEDFIEEHGGA